MRLTTIVLWLSAATFAMALPLEKRAWIDLPNPDADPRKGPREFRALRDTRQLFLDLKGGVYGDVPPWAAGLPNVLSNYKTGVVDGFDRTGYVPFAKVPAAMIRALTKKLVWDMGKGGYKDDNGRGTPKVWMHGIYFGIPVNKAGETLKSAYGAVVAGYHYGDAFGAIGTTLDASGPWGPNGEAITVADAINIMANGPAGDGVGGDPALRNVVGTIQRNLYQASLARFKDIPGGVVRNEDGTDTFDGDALDTAVAGVNSETQGHAKILKGMVRMGFKLNAVQTGENHAETTNRVRYGSCSGSPAKRSLFKRAEDCIPEQVEVINDDTMGEGPSPHDLIKQTALNNIRAIKYATGNLKILPRDNGEGTSSDPMDNTELDPAELVEGAENTDEAMDFIEDAFGAILDKEPDQVDRGLVSKILKGMRKEVRMRIANNKGVQGVHWARDMINKRITAEAKKNAYDRLVDKYVDKFGNHPDFDDPDDPPAKDQDGNVDFSAFEISIELPFHEEDYEPPSITDAIATSDVLEIASEVIPGMKKLDGAPTTEEGGETYIDPTHALPGTNEYANMVRAMAVSIRDIVKDPKTPKWKLVKIRAMLARNAKSVDARYKILDQKQKEGKEISPQEADELDALTALQNSAADSLSGRDMDSMEETPEDTAQIDAMSKYTPDPRRVVTVAKRPPIKAQKGKPASWRTGMRQVLPSDRKTRGVVKSKQGNTKSGGS
ncbi:hypothetical protein BGZ82_011602 [Podila clonocystis]|nr:hypothetical protein BGZ82_011602 [Podila clonocystis]